MVYINTENQSLQHKVYQRDHKEFTKSALEYRYKLADARTNKGARPPHLSPNYKTDMR